MSVGESLGIYNICIISPLFFHSLSQFLAPGSSPYTLISFLLETVIKTVSFIKHMLLAPSPDLQRETLKNWVGSGDEANMLYLFLSGQGHSCTQSQTTAVFSGRATYTVTGTNKFTRLVNHVCKVCIARE